MIIFFAADTFGQIGKLCDRIAAKAEQIRCAPDWVFHVGSLGVWPDPKHTDHATREKGTQTDFHEWYLRSRPMPWPTLFVPGKHEDHRWLEVKYQQGYFELLPNLYYQPNGFARVIECTGMRLSVVTLGGVFSPIIYKGERKRKKTYCHYTRRDVEKACSAGPVEVFLTTEAGYKSRVGPYVSQAAGINNVCFATRPRIMAHGHYNVSTTYHNPVTETYTIGLEYGEVRPYAWDGAIFRPLCK